MLLLAFSGCARDRDPPLMGDDVVAVDASGMPKPGENLVSVVETPAPPPYAGPAYFPASLAAPSVRCDYGRRRELEPTLNDFEKDWYSRQLAAAGEPSLAGAAEHPLAPGVRTVRFTWLRSFTAPVVIRVERDASGTDRLVAKRLSGTGGDPPGEVAATFDRPLTREESARLDAVLGRTQLFELPPRLCDGGLDGAQWIFESADARGYRFVQRWSPRKGALHDAGAALMALTGWDFGMVY